MKQTNRESGVAHAAVVIVLVLVILGLLGFVFWQNFLQKKPAAKSSHTTAATTKRAADPYSGWKTYTNSDLGISLRYPSDWTLGNVNGNNLPMQVATLASPDIAAETKGSLDAMQYDVVISSQSKSEASPNSMLGTVYALQQEQAGKDTSNFFAKKYSETINSVAVTEFDMLAQENYFAALLSAGGNYIEVDFVHTPTKADLTETTGKILRSLKTS